MEEGGASGSKRRIEQGKRGGRGREGRRACISTGRNGRPVFFPTRMFEKIKNNKKRSSGKN
jgi:hypothetical protein